MPPMGTGRQLQEVNSTTLQSCYNARGELLSPRRRLLGAWITFLLGLALLYVCGLSNILQNVIVGPNPTEEALNSFNYTRSLVMVGGVPLTLLGSIALAIYTIEAVVRRAKHRPTACPGCAVVESTSGVKFSRSVVKGTIWNELTCPKCGHSWHERRS